MLKTFIDLSRSLEPEVVDRYTDINGNIINTNASFQPFYMDQLTNLTYLGSEWLYDNILSYAGYGLYKSLKQLNSEWNQALDTQFFNSSKITGINELTFNNGIKAKRLEKSNRVDTDEYEIYDGDKLIGVYNKKFDIYDGKTVKYRVVINFNILEVYRLNLKRFKRPTLGNLVGKFYFERLYMDNITSVIKFDTLKIPEELSYILFGSEYEYLNNLLLDVGNGFYILIGNGIIKFKLDSKITKYATVGNKLLIETYKTVYDLTDKRYLTSKGQYKHMKYKWID